MLYDVYCEMSKEACETQPGTLCDVLPWAATVSSPPPSSPPSSPFEDAFDGDVPVGRRLAASNGRTTDYSCRPDCDKKKRDKMKKHKRGRSSRSALGSKEDTLAETMG